MGSDQLHKMLLSASGGLLKLGDFGVAKALGVSHQKRVHKCAVPDAYQQLALLQPKLSGHGRHDHG